jgi:Na+-translocating ferredoxin:NAD+ oxidoreductase RNF subunit RnfB
MRSKRNRTKYIYLDKSKCEACWDCIDECKHDVLGKVDVWFHKHVVIKNAENCRGCQSCIAVCPNGVFGLINQTRTAVNH